MYQLIVALIPGLIGFVFLAFLAFFAPYGAMTAIGVVLFLLFGLIIVAIIRLMSPYVSQRLPVNSQPKQSNKPKQVKSAKPTHNLEQTSAGTTDGISGGQRLNHYGGETLPYNPSPDPEQERVPVQGAAPALRTARPLAPPPPPPAPLLKTRHVDDEEEKIEWIDPEPYTDEERTNHPHDRAEWIHFGSDWTIVAASARGKEHRDKKYRDDDFAVTIFTDEQKGFWDYWRVASSKTPYAAIIAIADGLGSKPLSRHGARAATKGAIGVDEGLVQAVFARVRKNGGHPEFVARLNEVISQSATDLLRAAFDNAARAVNEQAKKDRVRVEELHSTLIIIVAIINPHDRRQLVLITSQVGDGAVYTKSQVVAAASIAPDPAVTPAAPIVPHAGPASDPERTDNLMSAGDSDPTPDSPVTGVPVVPDSAGSSSSSDAAMSPDGWRWLQQPQVEPTGTQVTPFMTRYEADRKRLITDQRCQATQLTCLMAMTDGPAEAITPYDPDGIADHFEYARPFYADVTDALVRANMQATDNARGEAFTGEMKLLLQDKLGVGDDITLACLLRNDLLSAT